MASMGIYRHNPAQIVVAGFVHAGLSCVRSHDLSPWHRAGRAAPSLEGGEDDRGTLRVGLRDWTFIRHAGLHVEDFGAANWGSASRWNGSSDNLLHSCCRVSHSIRGTWSSPAVQFFFVGCEGGPPDRGGDAPTRAVFSFPIQQKNHLSRIPQPPLSEFSR